MRSLAFGLLAWIALFPAAHAQDDIERAHTYHRRAVAGQEVRILTYVQHRSGCVQGPDPQIKLTTQPAHGSIAIRPGSVQGSRSRFGAGDCSNELNGLTLWYTPEAGYAGTDQFEYDVVFRNGTAHDTAVIAVK